MTLVERVVSETAGKDMRLGLWSGRFSSWERQDGLGIAVSAPEAGTRGPAGVALPQFLDDHGYFRAPVAVVERSAGLSMKGAVILCAPPTGHAGSRPHPMRAPPGREPAGRIRLGVFHTCLAFIERSSKSWTGANASVLGCCWG